MLFKRFKKIIFRIFVTVLVFVLIKFTMADDEGIFDVSTTSIYYFITTLFFFLSTWELNDRLINRHIKINQQRDFQWFSDVKVLIQTLCIMLPVCAITYYIGTFYFAGFLELDVVDSWSYFFKDLLRAGIIGATLLIFNIIYSGRKVKEQFANKMTALHKEVVEANYQSLKSQISPHFLFNSLNTLTSLMYQDRDLASDFTSKLASCYRYVLDNSEKDLISLKSELAFMDSFIFMMDVRHKKALNISVDIKLETHNYVLPTLTLQMLVENALKHNYYSKENPLYIKIANTKGSLIISNTLSKRTVVEASTGIGLNNIRNRYSYYSDKPVEIYEDESLFKVILPLLDKSVEKKHML